MNKKIVLSFLGILILSKLYSQQFTVSILKPQPIAYIGLDNPVSCTVEKQPCDSVILSTDNGTITKIGCNSYWYRPIKVADSKIIVLIKGENDTIKVGEYYIRVRQIPDPSVAIGGISGGEITKGNIKAQGGISSYLHPSMGIDIKYMVTEFQLNILQKGIVVFSEKNNGPAFSKTIKDAFNKLENHDVILVSQINVKKPDGRIVIVNPMEFIIKK
jgi:GldM C-terminal domain